MIETAARAYRRALVRWTAGVHRLAWLVVIASIVATGAAIGYLADNIRINTNTDDMLSPDLPFRQDSRDLDAAFPQFNDNIVIVIDGQTPDLANDAARKFAQGLRRKPELFGGVYDPPGSDFMRRNGLLYLDLDELYDLSDKLAEAQPFLATLWRDPSLVGLFHMLNLAIDEFLKDKDGSPIEIVKVLEAIAAVAEAQAGGRFGHLSWQELMSGSDDDDGSTTGKRRIMVVQPALDFGSLRPGGKAMGELRRLARSLQLTPDNGVSVRLTGSVALAHEEMQSVEKGMGFAGVLSLTLVIGLLVIGLGSLSLVAATFTTLIMGLIWTATFAILALGSLNLISVAFAVLFIGLSVDFGIHYGLRYKEGMDRGDAHAEALLGAASGVGGALTLCAVSAAIAFYSFLPTDYLGLAELGLIAGTGMFIAFFANITVLPALLTVIPRPKAAVPRTPGRLVPFVPVIQSFIQRRSRAICFSALGLGLAAALLLPKAAFDFDPLNLKDRRMESVATMFDLMEDSHTGPYSITILADNLEAAGALAEKLDTLAEVDGTAVLTDFVPDNQDEKLDIIATMGLFLSPAFASAGIAASPTLEDRQAALGEFRARLRTLAGLPGASPESSSATRLLKGLSGLFGEGRGNGATFKAFEDRLLRALPGRLEALNASLEAEPVNLESLPRAITERQIAADGRARLKVYPKGDLRDREALARFVASVRTVAAHATGSPVVILEAGKAVIAAFWQAGAISVLLISVLLIVILGRLMDAVLVFAPLLLAALLTVAASVIFNLPFNFANVIVLPLLFGLGVAGGIHLVLREREEKGVADVLGTSTPRAVVFSALTTIGSFGSIALSDHPGTSSMGVLLTIAITLTLGCTLVVLPALMIVTGERAGKAGNRDTH